MNARTGSLPWDLSGRAKTPEKSSTDMTETNIELAHRWQEFRIRCLELAVKGGATEKNMIEVADRIGLYILKRSEVEIGATKIAEMQRAGKRT